MAIVIRLHGISEARYGALTVKGHGMSGPMNKMARLLIAQGKDPRTLVEVYRGKTLCFKPVPLQWWADYVATESAAKSVRFKKYVPMPDL